MEYAHIALTNGGETIIDQQDAPLANEHRWHRNTYGYVRSSIRQGNRTVTIYLHRLIMQTPPGMDTDHINGDRLNNTRANLRVCTRSQNAANQRAIRGRSAYRGVTWHRGRSRWNAEIKIAGRKVHIGTFASEVDAARAYNARASELYGTFAHLNIIPE